MKLQTWKPNIIDGSTWIIVSARRSGKTVFTKFLCSFDGGFIDKSDKVIVMTTGCNVDSWSGLIDEKDIFIDYQPEVLEKILEFQSNLKLDDKKMPVVTIILDDLMVATTKSTTGCSQYDPTLWRIFSVGRHYNICLVLISQSISLIGLNFLRNCDYFCFFRFCLKNDRKKLIELIGQYASEDEAQRLIEKPERYHIFILELTSEGYDLKDKLHTFKVPEKFLKL